MLLRVCSVGVCVTAPGGGCSTRSLTKEKHACSAASLTHGRKEDGVKGRKTGLHEPAELSDLLLPLSLPEEDLVAEGFPRLRQDTLSMSYRFTADTLNFSNMRIPRC